MDTIAAIHGRRSVRSYDSRPVERDLIESVILDAAQAPPPFRDSGPLVAFNVIEGVARIAAYGERAMDHARRHRPGAGHWDWIDRPGFKIFWDAPALVIISGPMGDCHRAGQNFMLSAHARGLGTSWVGSPMLWLSTPEVRAELAIPSDLMPVAALCLGHPAAVPEAVPRQPPRIIWVAENAR